MSPRPSLCAFGVLALASTPVFGQFVAPHYSVGRIGSQVIVRPPFHTLGYGAFDPNYTGLRPSYWSLPGRYNAYPWSGAGVFTGGTAVNAFYAPSVWWGGCLDSAWTAPYGLAGYDYIGDSNSGYLFPATAYAGAYRNSLPASAGASAAPADRAMLSVQAPSDAKIWIQGSESKGSERVFTSPRLKPGQEYSYSVKAQWKVNDKTVEQSQTVSVKAGERAGLLFISGNEAAAAPGR